MNDKKILSPAIDSPVTKRVQNAMRPYGMEQADGLGSMKSDFVQRNEVVMGAIEKRLLADMEEDEDSEAEDEG